jgi:putative hydrolase of the HAD superfamily
LTDASPSIKAVISDFGGVLTTPLMDSFLALQDEIGISVEAFGKAMMAVAERDGENPLYVMEKGLMTEERFLEVLGEALEPELGHKPELHRFREVFFNALEVNEPMVELMRDLKSRGYRMALLTNNVKEWEPAWRPMTPVDEIFEFVVDSAYVGTRKPEPEIYNLTVERFGGDIAPKQCIFIDDVEIHCDAARELGISAVHYREPDQAIGEIREALGLAAVEKTHE